MANNFRLGRVTEDASTLLNEFNASIMFDKELFDQDIRGSIAHSKMLCEAGILTKEEQASIEKGMAQVRSEIETGSFEWKIDDEDLHMAIEKRLTDIIGDAGKKLHTARSRNDQVATDFRLYTQDKNLTLMSKIAQLCEVLLNIAQKNSTVLMPGMTHLQHAQPINFGYHMCAYVAMFKRDFERFQSSFARNNLCPLGSAALAGTPHNIDRFLTASLLGFDSPTINAMDSVSDRDFALEILFNISVLMTHISRFAEELILWSSYEFKFIAMSDKYSTGSSIMPQKKNPDVPELLRGKTGRVYGNLIGLLSVMKGLPLAYNKDTQEDKEGVFDSVKTAQISIEILKAVVETMSINEDKMLNACKVGHLTATDLADFMVKNMGIAFREAYFITKKAVNFGESMGKDVSEFSLEEIRSIDDSLAQIDASVLDVLSLRSSMNSRNSYGGTSTNRTNEQILILREWLESLGKN